MEKITLLLIDDHRLLIDAWSLILGRDERFKIIGETGDAQEAYQVVMEKHPKIVLTDINMNPVDGFVITKMINSISKISRVIGVSMHCIPAYVKKLLRIGAWGYVTKNSSIDELKTAIVEISEGRKYICNEIKNMLAHEEFQEVSIKPKELSKKELEVMLFIRQGMISKEIAVELNISVKTIEVHRYNILRKLNLRNTAALVNYMHQKGI